MAQASFASLAKLRAAGMIDVEGAGDVEWDVRGSDGRAARRYRTDCQAPDHSLDVVEEKTIGTLIDDLLESGL